MTYYTLSGNVEILHDTYDDRPTVRFKDYLPLVEILRVIHDGRICWVFQHTMDDHVYMYKPYEHRVVRFTSTVQADLE